MAIANLDSLQMSRIKAIGDNTDSIELDVEPLKTKVTCVEVTCPPAPETETQY